MVCGCFIRGSGGAETPTSYFLGARKKELRSNQKQQKGDDGNNRANQFIYFRHKT